MFFLDRKFVGGNVPARVPLKNRIFLRYFLRTDNVAIVLILIILCKVNISMHKSNKFFRAPTPFLETNMPPPNSLI